MIRNGLFSLGFLFLMPVLAFAQDVITLSEEQIVGQADKAWGLWWAVAPVGAVIALIFALIFYKTMMKASEGNERMVEIAGHVKKGAMAYLAQQYKVVTIAFIILCGILAFMAYGLQVQHWLVPWAFLTGGFFSGLAGYLGMRTATEASGRTAQGASENLNNGLQIAFRSGAVMGLVVVGLALIDIAAWFYVLYGVLGPERGFDLQHTTVIMLAFGMGASTQALFARVGGGIFTKAADVGADLVGKVEAGIPEDDPRNPATIADNVGDNVGDVAGMGADLYESYAGSVLATAAIGYAASHSIADANGFAWDERLALPWVFLPMIIAGMGNIVSIIGIYAVQSKEDTSLKALMAALFRGINLATILAMLGTFGAAWYMLGSWPVFGENVTFMNWGGVGLAVVVGLIAGWVIGKATEYYTSFDYEPTKNLAAQGETGPATVIIDGVAVGMMSTGIPVIAVVLGIILSFGVTGGFTEPILGLYGVAIAAVGMLSTLGITLATDAYGPIADNAGGNAQMAGLDPQVRERTDALDSLGNTTAATGKGFAIGSAALTALALLAAYLEEIRAVLKLPAFRDIANNFVEGVRGATDAAAMSGDKVNELVVSAKIHHFMEYYDVQLMNPKVLCGVFIGSMAAFVFCALTMKAVGRAAQGMVREVRRQFKEIPGIMEGTGEPDYARCVAISTESAQKEMVVPSTLAIATPIVTGLLFGVGGVIGLLAGTLSTGFVLAVMMANAGGAWDNAKKWVEKGHHGGKGSEAHHATVIGDTVGDPFKDTSGPSLNILIKLMTMVSVVFVGLIVKFSPMIQGWLGIG